VLRISPLSIDVFKGVWPPKAFSFCVNGRTLRFLRNLTDDVDLMYPFSVYPYPSPVTTTEGSEQLQEVLREDVWRLYGVLTTTSHSLLHLGRFGFVEEMMLAVEVPRRSYGTGIKPGSGGLRLAQNGPHRQPTES